MICRLASTVVALVLACALVSAHPAPRPQLQDELPGWWTMIWGINRYEVLFEEDGAYYWRSANAPEDAEWQRESWFVDTQGFVVIRDCGRPIRLRLRRTAIGWVGTSEPIGGSLWLEQSMTLLRP